jgi:adenine-specific DNA-methyltransferase
MKMPTDSKNQIRQALAELNQVATGEGVKHLLEILGYVTPREVPLDSATPIAIIDLFGWQGFREDKGFLEEWSSIDCLLQVTEEEIVKDGRLQLFKANFDKDYLSSYLFLGLTLKNSLYSRGKLAAIAREINRQSPIPIMVVFRYGDSLTLAIIDRRPNQVQKDRDILEKITLIKDIQIASPHRAHIEILQDLALSSLKDVRNFDDLHREWQKVLDTSELNKKFFQEVSNWYFWAIQTVIFPDGGEPDSAIRNATGVIRLITRLIFVWFLKEKGLIPPILFEENGIKNLLKSFEGSESSYYKAILQNLFFATLNTEMNSATKPDNRKFRGKATKKGDRDQHYGIANVYRYEDYFTEPDRFLELCRDIPFLNGGLFECLDKTEEKPVIRIDGFSDRADNLLHFPNDLFFGTARRIDLNTTYGTSNRKYEVRGILEIFNRYKFTIDENTPVEEEIALDPELLGKVFENLLAEYNPETETTARKQTGSFYTPREIVNYMVDESLVAYLQNALLQESVGYRQIGSDQINLFGNEYTSGQLSLQTKVDANPFLGRENELNESLHHLLSYCDECHRFGAEEVKKLIGAIDTVKIIDIACGSGAFPMGILQKLVFILGKLDPNNTLWKQQQKEREIQPVLKDIQVAKQISYEEAREEAIRKLENRIKQIEEDFEGNEKDYARKLFLIENCIFGVDIQAIAVQIAKLRFFISLIVDQTVNDTKPNRGILPLPNLETKFVAANSLIGINTQLTLRSPAVLEKEAELKKVRQVIFQARTSTTKQKYRDKDRSLRQEICELLKATGFESATADTLARWNPYDFNVSSDFFDPEWMFGVADFDICIGNPPYVRIQELNKSLPLQVKYFKNNYQSARKGNYDIYVVFVERGINILKQCGHLAYILPHKFFNAQYGEGLRDLISKGKYLRKIVHFGDNQVFNSATTYTCLLFLDKSGSQQCDFIKVNNTDEWHNTRESEQNYINYTKITKNDWNFNIGNQQNVIDKLEDIKCKLKDISSNIFQGLVTSCDPVYLLEPSEILSDNLIRVQSKETQRAYILESSVLHHLCKGAKDIDRYSAQPSKLVLFPYDIVKSIQSKKGILISQNQFMADFPRSWQYLLENKEKLENRENGKMKNEKWYGYVYPKSISLFCRKKIINPSIALEASYTLDTKGQLYFVGSGGGGGGGYGIILNNDILLLYEYVLGLLNSKLLDYYLKSISTPFRGGYYAYNRQYIEKLPIVNIDFSNIAKKNKHDRIVDLVTRILEIKRQNPHANTDELETAIDKIVYQLYGLTEEEISLVEEATRRK